MLKKIFKKLLYVYWIILLLLVSFELSPKSISYKKDNPWINESKRPWIIPHGGAKALYPENTILAFKETAHYDVFEVDLTLTKDDILISHHDLDIRHDLLLQDLSDDLLVRNLTYQEIIDQIQLADYPYARSFVDPDGLMPYAGTTDQAVLDLLLPQTLESLFDTYPNKMFILELKDLTNESEDTFSIAANELLSLISAYDMADHVMVSSFDDAVITYFRSISEGKIHTSAASNETLKVVLMSAFSLDFFYQPKDAALAMPVGERLSEGQINLIRMLPKRIQTRIMRQENGVYYTELIQKTLIDDLSRHNMASIYWTVNDTEEMKQLIALDVDGIITDRPDLLEQVLLELGL
jgi:glycerophosphoryl diester phosphodiesterase